MRCDREQVFAKYQAEIHLIGRLGRIPEDDEVIEMELHGWLFQVEAFEEKRIMKVLASKLPEEEQTEEDAEDDKEKNEE